MALTFPFHVGPIHPHQFFDVLSFLVGGQLFWHMLRRSKTLALDAEQKLVLAAGCVIGAALGAKIIVTFADPGILAANWRYPLFWITGKSIVGALLGGLIGVELAKKHLGIQASTGDHFVIPLAVGLAIGRIGCFLSGLDDDTYGTFTTLPWAVDFGDGLRHPTQLYEVAFAIGFLALIPLLRKRARESGDLFRLFMVSYFAFRFLEEFIRVSPHPYFGLSIYQLASLAGIGYYAHGQWARRAAVRSLPEVRA